MGVALLLALVFVACVAFVVGVVYLIVRSTMRAEREREARWAEWAAGLGGQFVPGSGGFFFRTPALVVVPHGYAWVRLDKYVVSTGKTSTTYTRARARFTLGFGPRFRVSAEGILSAVGKALGAQDLLLDDPAFDPRFVIKGDSPDAIRWAWTPLARQAALHLGGPNVTSTGDELTALVLGTLNRPEDLGAMVAMVGELASFRIPELAALASAAEATLQFPTDGSTPPTIRLATSRGEVMAALGREGLAMRIVDERGLPPLEVTIEGGHAHGLAGGLLSDDARALLPRVGVCRIKSGDGLVWLSWRGTPDARTFRAGAELLVELAGGGAARGAFR
ncbi:MAG: hypothetical protein KF901_15545 [Myxococcales bacterium]|nr:hypothetical protein [Myxococcales bacterium]